MTIDHPGVKTIWFQNLFEAGKWNRQMVVEASYVLDTSHGKYDGEKVASLEQAVEAFMQANPGLFDSVIVRPWRPNF